MPIFDSMQNRQTFFSILLILGFIAAVNTVQTYVLHVTRQFGDIDFYNTATHLIGFVACLISLGSTILAWKLARKLSTIPVRLAAISFILSIVIYAISEAIVYAGNRFISYGLPTNFDLLIGNFVFTTIIFHLYISGLTLAYLTFREHAQTTIQLQQTQKEKELLQYKIMQKNLEPHFLFNNLSVLSGLVHQKPKEAESFISDFSEVYRYYLNHSREELVDLRQEILFLKKYLKLMTTRFGEVYQTEINIPDQSGYILPGAAQLAVENAIKHNRASIAQPLKIKVRRENDNLIVENELYPVDYTHGAGLGNQFLQKSYEVNFNKKVTFVRTVNTYRVEIPLIV